MAVRGSQPVEMGTTISTRDMMERVEYLESLDDTNEGDEPYLDEDESDELAWLRDALDELGSRAEDGVSLIREDYFEDYAQQYAEDLHGRAIREASWPFDCIDWEKATAALQSYYTSIRVNGEDYWYNA